MTTRPEHTPQRPDDGDPCRRCGCRMDLVRTGVVEGELDAESRGSAFVQVCHNDRCPAPRAFAPDKYRRTHATNVVAVVEWAGGGWRAKVESDEPWEPV